MLKNYFNIALRSLRRNVMYSVINLAGLSIGIACTILILLWVHDEVTFNKSFSKYDNLHLVRLNSRTDNGIITDMQVPYPLKNELLQQDSRIKNMSIMIYQSALLSVGEKKIRKTGVDASEAYLDMFDYKIIHGDRNTALKDMMSIVLTQSTAIALFGTDDVVGKIVTVKIGDAEDLKVTAVIADPPVNVSVGLSFIIPFSYFEKTSDWLTYAQTNWANNAFYIYTELQPGAKKEDVDASIKDLIKTKSGNTVDVELFLQPMSRWRLYNTYENGKEAGGLIDYVIMFSCIGVFILLMACINFMNLATARSQHRAREVGIRKSIGSSRKQLIMQFMGESMIMATISLLTAIVIVQSCMPMYNTLVNKTLFIDFTSPLFWVFSLGLVFITGIVAGSYPALYLSSFKPAKILKGNLGTDKKGNTPRQLLVIVQNAFSILLIIGTAIVYLQILHLKSREKGYDQENLMMLWSNVDIEKNYHALKGELESSGAALSVTKSNSPITRIFSSSLISWPGMIPGQRVDATNIATEYDYIRTMGVRLLEGRDFSPEFKSDTAAIIINKAAVDVMNLENPIGQQITMWESSWTIIGVMDNVLMGSGSSAIQPLVMTMDPNWSTTITLRIPKTADMPGAVKKVEDIFKKYNPDYPFEYRFADVEFQDKFSTINMTSSLSGVFAVLAILITALGLLGMAAFTAEQRTKEIGIRKVLGASVSSVLILLTKDFSKMVIIAFLISAPFAWWVASNFLEQYQLRIEMPLWIFPLAGILSLTLTVLIVVTQALRAATSNPVNSLRNE